MARLAEVADQLTRDSDILRGEAVRRPAKVLDDSDGKWTTIRERWM